MQERNDLGLQLIERNEEVCVFYERQNVSESLLRKAGMELSAREEELHFLRMEVREGGERKGREGGREIGREGGREWKGEGGKGEGGSTCSNCGIVCTWEASDKGCAPPTYTRTHYQLSKLQNDLLVSRKALPEKTKLEEELTTAQVEVRVGG